jgi:superfamily II DNA/RNA helicase
MSKPRDVESYIHRIGRTGRAGASGVSITFFNHAYDMECAPALAKIAEEAGQVVPDFLKQAAEKTKNTKNKLWKY